MASLTAARPDLGAARRLVVKIGSALLVDGKGGLRGDWLRALAADVAGAKARGSDVILVSSGSIALGRGVLGLPKGALSLDQSQAAASVGQIRLARAYEEALAPHGLTAGQVLVTNGGKQALYNTFAALLDPGDEALLPAPYWTTYPESIQLAGGVPVVIPTDEDTGYKVSVAALDEAVTANTKLLVFVSPSNPTGAVYTPDEVAAIGRWAVEKGIWVVTDEIYEHLVYGSAEFSSMPVQVPELAETCVIVNGVAKTYAMTGWRVGWMIGPTDVVKAATNLQSHATSNVANVSQRAALAAVTGDLSAVAVMREAFDRRRLTIVDMLNAIPGVTCPVPEGAFYAYPSVRGVLGRSIRGKVAQTSAELAEIILDEAEVAVVPGEAFGTEGYLRLSYALGDDDLVEGVERIAALLSE